MASDPQSTHRSPGPRAVVGSPVANVLLPPAEINVSPARSVYSNYPPSSASSWRSRASNGDEGERHPRSSRAPHSPPQLPSRNHLKSTSENKIYPNGSSDNSFYEESFWHDGSTLRRSTSSKSITVKNHGCFVRLRRSPNFILFTVFLALFVDMATYGIIVPIIPFIISDKVNGGATDTGLLLAIYAIGILISAPLFGVLGDRFVSRRIPMLIGLVGMLLSTALFMLGTNFYVFLTARLLQGVAGGSVWTLGLALITDVFPAHTLGLQMGKALVGYTLGLMMGPPLGGILYERGGYQAPFIFCFVITLIDFICRALIIEEREEVVKALRLQGMQEEAMEEKAEVVALRKKERQEDQTSFWKLIKNKRLLGCVIVTACNAFVFSGAEPTVPLHLATTFDLTSERIGLVFMAFSLPTLTAPISGALSDRFGAKIVCLVSLVACGASVIVLGLLESSLPMIILLFTIIGTTGTAILTPVLGELSAVVRTTGTGDGFARAYAIFNMAFSIGVLVGPIVCGLVYEHLGFQRLCFTMSASLFLGIPIAALWFGGQAQRRRDLEKYEEDEAKMKPGLPQQRLTRSKYSFQFADNGEEGGEKVIDIKFLPRENALADKGAAEEDMDASGLVGMSQAGSKEEILKTACLN
ncbi:hypothetical protein BGZ50_005337 [Haplosporangium sp. Z 11]|nr:hypothetical protein BGZ50_005337 [Haplosporangium sp. Z 11]